MFTPSQHDVRTFFCDVLRRHREGAPLSPLEAIAAHWVQEHPEFHPELSDLQAALEASYTVEEGRTNPFLHLSMHLSLSEQVSIDQPPGIRQAMDALSQRLGSLHSAQHEAMECLGDMLWQSQRSGRPPDGQAYVDCVRRRATRR